MSRAFVKGDDSDLSGEEVPERPVSLQPNYVTPLGLAQLRDKYESLIARHAQLKAAGEDFDKPKLTEIERDLRYFSQRLDSAIPVDVSSEPQDEVHFGATVKTESAEGERTRIHDRGRGRGRRRHWQGELAVTTGQGADRLARGRHRAVAAPRRRHRVGDSRDPLYVGTFAGSRARSIPARE